MIYYSIPNHWNNFLQDAFLNRFYHTIKKKVEKDRLPLACWRFMEVYEVRSHCLDLQLGTIVNGLDIHLEIIY